MKKWQQTEFKKLAKIKKNGADLELIKVTRLTLEPIDLETPIAVLKFLNDGFTGEIQRLERLVLQLLAASSLAEWKQFLKNEKEKNGIPK